MLPLVGKTLSKDERDRKKLGAEKSLIYGEVEFNSFYRVLRKINPAPGLVRRPDNKWENT